MTEVMGVRMGASGSEGEVDDGDPALFTGLAFPLTTLLVGGGRRSRDAEGDAFGSVPLLTAETL